MDILNNNKYNEFYDILSGCRTILDAFSFAQKYIKANPEMKNIVMSMINGKRYEYVMDMNGMISLMERLDFLVYKEDVIDLIETYLEKTLDPTQRKALYRVANLKALRPKIPEPSKIKLIKTTFISKKCPHCGLECTVPENTHHTICGYENKITGYNLIGCGCDWCFKCGKMLCKKWNTNQLFLDDNKHHDGICCRLHAEENNNNYEEEYCMCLTEYVDRKLNCE